MFEFEAKKKKKPKSSGCTVYLINPRFLDNKCCQILRSGSNKIFFNSFKLNSNVLFFFFFFDYFNYYPSVLNNRFAFLYQSNCYPIMKYGTFFTSLFHIVCVLVCIIKCDVRTMYHTMCCVCVHCTATAKHIKGSC